MKRTALYILVFTEEQAQIKEGSLKSQEQRLREYVDRKNSESSKWGQIVAVFIEEGRSGKDMERPELQKMLLGIKQSLFDVVMVTEISRLSRSTRDFCNLLELFKAQNCQILSLREQFDTTTAAGEMMMHMLMNFAQFERQQTAERVKANIRARIKRGLYNGGSAPLGYTFDPEHKGRLKIIEEEARTVKECFNTFLKEGSLAAACKSLNKRGFAPKKFRIGGGKYRVGLPHFTFYTLHRILTNPVYIAKRKLVEEGKQVFIPAQWAPILDENIFFKVKETLSRNKDRYKPDTYKIHPYLLSGLLECGICGQVLIGKSSHGRSKKYFYYAHGSQIRRNSTTQNPGCHCPLGQLSAIPLEKSIMTRIKTLVEESGVVSGFLEKAKQEQNTIILDQKISEQKKRIDNNRYKIEALLTHLEKMPTGSKAHSFYGRLKELEDQKDKLHEELSLFETELMTQVEVTHPEVYLDR